MEKKKKRQKNPQEHLDSPIDIRKAAEAQISSEISYAQAKIQKY